MRLQDHMVEIIRSAQREAFRYARTIPENRLEWEPLGTGQSVLRMLRELAKTPDWAYYVLTDAVAENSNEAVKAQKAEMESWTSVDDCEAACLSKLEPLFVLYRTMSEGRLSETKWLPFNGGRDHTYAELLDYPRWNFVYHLGQMVYVRSLMGKVD